MKALYCPLYKRWSKKYSLQTGVIQAPGWVLSHNSPLYGDADDHPTSVKSTIDMYIGADVPRSSLGIGIGFYGNCWSSGAQWPHEPYNASKLSCGDGDMSYTNIKREYYNNGNEYFYDNTTQNLFLVIKEPRGKCACTMISYEDEVSIAAKANFVHAYGLGGTIIWHMEEGYIKEDPTDSQRLLHSLANSFWKRVSPASLSKPSLCRNYPDWNSNKVYVFGDVVKYENRYHTVFSNSGMANLIPPNNTWIWKAYEFCN